VINFINENPLSPVMHKLHKKRGKKKETHYFHHVKEKDGSKKHVYLGSDEKKSKDRLTKLKVERIRSNNKLVRQMDKTQQKLSKLGHYNKSYDDIVDDVIKKHHIEKHVEHMVSTDNKSGFPFAYIIGIIALIGFGTTMYFFVQNPTITGAAVQTITSLAANRLVSTAAGMFAVILILGLVLHAVDHHHKHRYDKFKPPMPPD
jgi:hypothetical protein